jgi:hypothetical protein
MRSAPAEDAVVTVTDASPNSRCSGLSAVSIVWMREIGAIRHSSRSHPARV